MDPAGAGAVPCAWAGTNCAPSRASPACRSGRTRSATRCWRSMTARRPGARSRRAGTPSPRTLGSSRATSPIRLAIRLRRGRASFKLVAEGRLRHGGDDPAGPRLSRTRRAIFTPFRARLRERAVSDRSGAEGAVVRRAVPGLEPGSPAQRRLTRWSASKGRKRASRPLADRMGLSNRNRPRISPSSQEEIGSATDWNGASLGAPAGFWTPARSTAISRTGHRLSRRSTLFS